MFTLLCSVVARLKPRFYRACLSELHGPCRPVAATDFARAQSLTCLYRSLKTPEKVSLAACFCIAV